MYYYRSQYGVQMGTAPVDEAGYEEITAEQYAAELAALEAAREAVENNWL